MTTVTVTPLPQRQLAETRRDPSDFAYMGKPHTPSRDTRRQRFVFWSDSIIDWMLLNPDKNMKDCAAALNRSHGALLDITRSDIFKARLAQRRHLFNQQLADKVGMATQNVALAALNEIANRITTNAAAIPTVVLADVADKALERMGYGVKPVGPQVVVNNSSDNRTIGVSAEVLREAKESMKELHRQNSTIISVEPTRLPSSSEVPLESIL